MPGVPFLGIADNGTMSTWDIVCVHTIVGYQSGGNVAHFTTGANGHIVQARDTTQRSAANYNGNWRVIAIENEDFGPAYGSWAGSNVPPFTPLQCEAIAKIMVWCHKVHNIPLELVPDSKVGRRGIAYHRQGIDGNFAEYQYGGRVSGGELWSTKYGKVCPGDRRITQLINTIIPRARVLAGLEEDDSMWLDELVIDPATGKPARDLNGNTFNYRALLYYGVTVAAWDTNAVVHRLEENVPNADENSAAVWAKHLFFPGLPSNPGGSAAMHLTMGNLAAQEASRKLGELTDDEVNIVAEIRALGLTTNQVLELLRAHTETPG